MMLMIMMVMVTKLYKVIWGVNVNDDDDDDGRWWCPPEHTWYGVVLWVLRVLGQGLNQSARVFFIRAFSGCYAILTSLKEGETAVYGRRVDVLQS